MSSQLGQIGTNRAMYRLLPRNKMYAVNTVEENLLKKILVVDDSALIHQMYRLVMNRYSCTIVDAMNGQEALDILAVQTDVDLILLDINMPVMNGVQFLEKASTIGIIWKIPVIVISTEGKEEDTIRGLKLGARGYLKKPFHPSALHEMIDKIFKIQNAHAPTLHSVARALL